MAEMETRRSSRSWIWVVIVLVVLIIAIWWWWAADDNAEPLVEPETRPLEESSLLEPAPGNAPEDLRAALPHHPRAS